MIVLGIESSCDETGAALISDTKGLLADALHTQIDMHRAYGGVVPELASRDHIRRVIALTDEVLYKANLKRSDISAIAVTEGPGLAGALLAGNAVAHAMGFGLGIPVIGVHHLEGHLLAARLADPAPQFPFLALLGAVRQIRADGVKAHVGGQRDDVGLEITGKVRLGVHFGGLGNVAALDVGNDGQAGGAGQLQRFGVGAHAVQAQGLIIGDLHLVAARDALGGVDQRTVERDDILPRCLGGVGGGQVADLGVQAHADRAVCCDALVELVHVGKHADSSV